MATLNTDNENIPNGTSGYSQKQGVQKTYKIFEQRKTLQVLQQTPDNRLTRTPAGNHLNDKSGKSVPKKPFSIFQDASRTSTPKAKRKECVHEESQTEGESCCHCLCHDQDASAESAEDEAMRLMGQEEVPEDYWKELAENRRQALEDSLHENELLYGKIDKIKKENKRLSELAEHAQYFANILKEITGTEDLAKSITNPETAESESDCEDGDQEESRSDINGNPNLQVAESSKKTIQPFSDSSTDSDRSSSPCYDEGHSHGESESSHSEDSHETVASTCGEEEGKRSRGNSGGSNHTDVM